ncbi:CLUMA_CG016989, isoform A [Clunio marinus]|uniref:CLUMA_CG016989, isoform A n=1 Tax=Clunio marinus TaxID=568069 RepID=A0A1J1IUG6_9DIPT|nr:CLUMA_CG016989, isoform A [Clunio marinus]
MFTNWLTSDTPIKSNDSVIPMSLPPDVSIEVGPPPFTRFPAHSTIISSQSGYFRAAISRVTEAGKLHENTIFLPNITVEHFTPLFSYMYTGFLELNFENIFGVLLATHILHMPRALEICRDFLAHTQRQQQNEFYSSAVPVMAPTLFSKVVRPIASKPSNLGLNFVSPPKAPSNLLVPSHGTPFKTLSNISSDETLQLEQKSMKEFNSLEKPTVEDKKLISQKSTAINLTKVKSMEYSSTVNSNLNATTNESDKVVIDIASCDGPVRFRRILNEAFEQNMKSTVPVSTTTTEELRGLKYQSSNALSFHQQMARNINEQYNKQKCFPLHNNEESENSQLSGELFTCVYCNHTFKSKYCYQKHAKRHINPLNSILKCRDDCDSSDGDVKRITEQSTVIPVKRDSIKPLDMNVQYYPCKTCGCKFPSYYFVHKHRKLCHPEIGDGSIQPIQEENVIITEDGSRKKDDI